MNKLHLAVALLILLIILLAVLSRLSQQGNMLRYFL